MTWLTEEPKSRLATQTSVADGRVELSGWADLSASLVKHGMAWHYVKYAPDDEQLAVAEAIGRIANVSMSGSA